MVNKHSNIFSKSLVEMNVGEKKTQLVTLRDPKSLEKEALMGTGAYGSVSEESGNWGGRGRSDQ